MATPHAVAIMVHDRLFDREQRMLRFAPHHAAHYGGALKGVIAADAKLEASTKSGTAVDPAAFAYL